MEKDIFGIKMVENDANAVTIGDYFKKLLLTLWNEGESFSGKRPFGNSGWEHEVYASLARAGLCVAEFDDEGDLVDFDQKECDELIFEAIEGMS